MKSAWLVCLVFGSQLFAAPPDPEVNVNSRYTVESVVVTGEGWSTNLVSDREEKVSPGLRKDILSLIGAKLNPATLDDMAARLRKEFRARTVTHRVQRGVNPESVRVVFQITERPARFDVSVPKFLYSSKQGWSGAVEGTATVHQNAFTLGLVSDGDELVERYTGLRARYENASLGTDRLHLRVQFESYHDQWNGATRADLAPNATSADLLASPLDQTSGIYRTRQNVEPVVSFVLAKPLTVSVGTSFQRFQDQFAPSQIDAANAVITSLRFQERVEDADNRQDLDAGYNVRASTRVLGSDFVYVRQRWDVRYAFTRGKHMVSDDLDAGLITGQAPLFERYVAGNSSLLRGWNKFDIDPFGGNRMVANSVEYRYGVFQVFYDTGAVWDSGQPAILRHSVGVGLRQGAFFLAIALPLRSYRTEPLFMVGMNY